MKKILFCAFFLLLLGACKTKNQYSDIKTMHSDSKAIRSWLENYMDAIKTADVERILSYESEDICFWPANQPSFSGRDNLRKWFLAYFNYCIPSERYDLLDFVVYGDFAYLTGKYTVTGKIKQSGEEFRDNGKFINFFKRDLSGNWICTQSIWNSDNRTFDFHSQILDDFSGSWNLDLSKSITLPGIISSKLVIKQEGNKVIVSKTNELKDKEPEKSTFNYIIGSETENKLKSGILRTTSSLSPGKQTFTIKETLYSEKNGSKQNYKRITNYSLSAKGEILEIITDDIYPEGSLTKQHERHTEMVYTKF
jgi:ketosteroid isomerase-like protein